MAKEGMREKYSGKMTPDKFGSLPNSLLVNQKYRCNLLPFSNAQDSCYSIDHAVKQNEAIIRLLSRMLDALQSETPRGMKAG